MNRQVSYFSNNHNDPRMISGMAPLKHVTGDEWIEIVQDGINKRVQLTRIRNAEIKNGLSAYEIAVKNGFVGDEYDWLISLKGEDGTDGAPGARGLKGDSAYDLAVLRGFEGSVEDWLDSLKARFDDPPNDGKLYLRMDDQWIRAPYQLNSNGEFIIDESTLGIGPYETKIMGFLTHVQQTHAHGVTKEQVGLGSVINTRFVRVNDAACVVRLAITEIWDCE